MADLRRTPSLQHAVALLGTDVEETVQNMRLLDAAKIQISLNPARRLIKPLMEGRSIQWALDQCAAEKKSINRQPNANLIRAIYPFAEAKRVAWFREFPAHFYPIGSGISIPVRPSGFWHEDGRLNVLWAQCWKGRTLDERQKRLFATILTRAIMVGDFKEASCVWLDLREVVPKAGRSLEIVDGTTFGTLKADELKEQLCILIEAFNIFDIERSTRRTEKRKERKVEIPLLDILSETSSFDRD